MGEIPVPISQAAAISLRAFEVTDQAAGMLATGPEVAATLDLYKKGVATLLPAALRRLTIGLGRSLDAYTVTEDDGSEPAEHIAAATDHLHAAADILEQVWFELDQAQHELSGQHAAPKGGDHA